MNNNKERRNYIHYSMAITINHIFRKIYLSICVLYYTLYDVVFDLGVLLFMFGVGYLIAF